VFTAGEQEFFAARGFTNEPKRCLACRAAKRTGTGTGPRGGDRPLLEAVCAACGQKTVVSFTPTADRPVYCRECYQARRTL